MKEATLGEVCQYYEHISSNELNTEMEIKFPGHVNAKLLSELYLHYEKSDLDILSNREYLVNELPDFEAFETVIESAVFKKYNSSEESSIDYYDDSEILCDKGILGIIESLCVIGLETLESCSGLHLLGMAGLSNLEKYNFMLDETNDFWICPHVSFTVPDELASVYFNKLCLKLQKTGGLFRLSFDCGQIILEMEEIPGPGARWNSLLKAIYFWRNLEILINEIFMESNLKALKS